MIALYAGSSGVRGAPTRSAITYNGITLNNPNDTLSGNSGPDTYEVDVVSPVTSFDYVSETNQQRDGLEVYAFHKAARMVTLAGTIRAPSLEKLYDKIKALANACDPAKIAHDNDPDGTNPTNMFLALDFNTPTTDTTNYVTGLVPSRYYALPLKMPDPVISSYQDFTAAFSVTFLMADPRRYWQTQSSQSGAAIIDNSLADYRSWPTLTITMSGAGSATFSVTNTTTLHGAKTLTLDLSGLANGNTLTVDMMRRKITKTVSGTTSDYMTAYVSGDYFHIDPVASNAITYANTTNTSSRVLAWRRAFSI